MIMEYLSGDITSASSDRTANVIWYSGATIPRFELRRQEEYTLAFSMEPKHVNLQRLNNRAPVLNSHNEWQLSNVLGVVEKAWIDGGKGYATLKFSARDEVTPIWQDIQNGILRSVSMGAAIYDRQDITESGVKKRAYLAVDWEPMEISVVAIGADPHAEFLRGRPIEFSKQCGCSCHSEIDGQSSLGHDQRALLRKEWLSQITRRYAAMRRKPRGTLFV
jgi:hypothetical protein